MRHQLAVVALLAATPATVVAQAQPPFITNSGGFATVELEGPNGGEVCLAHTVYGPGAAAFCPATSLPSSGMASSLGTGNFGSTFGTASLWGTDVLGGWTTGAGFAMDWVLFNAGIVPSEIVFWVAVETSWQMSGVAAYPAYGLSGMDFEVNWGTAGANFAGTLSQTWFQYWNSPSPGLNPLGYVLGQNVATPPGPTAGGRLSVTTDGSAAVRFYMASIAQVGVPPGATVNVPGTVSVTTAARIAGIQFFSNGVDVSSQVSATFASGQQYRIGAPFTPVPEPGTIALLATGLLGVGLVAWRRRRTISRGDA